MKILWFYQYLDSYEFDNWLHLKFVESLKAYPGVEVLVYGPGISDGYPHLTTLPYDPKISADDIKRHFNFDAIILNTKSRMFAHYDPHKRIARNEWLPTKWSLMDVPKIMIEEDYHYEQDDSWYRENRIELILQRHYSQSQRQQTVPMKWFPFSVDTGVFSPATYSRNNKICFAGSTNRDVYKYRYNACEILKRANLIDVFANGTKHGAGYVRVLKDYVSHLSCSSTYMLTPAKMFEIMASGSVLLTNENNDLELLFPKGSYCTYKPDNHSIVGVARSILNDKDMREEIVKNGLEAIRTRHSHQVRINELLGIIKGLRNDAEVKS
jgi:hypothetical protein